MDYLIIGINTKKKLESSTCGAIAQLGERLHGMQEVGGSIPPSSTNLFFDINLLLISL